MIDFYNPFEYEAANKFSSEQILEFYIEDFNYSRFIRSRRNIMLVGERGTGKTMTLLYNSDPVQYLKKTKDYAFDGFKIICVYIPCNTTLTHKREYELLDKFSAALISEHFFVVSIMYSICDTLSKIQNLINDKEELKLIKKDVEFMFDIKLPESQDIFEGLKLFCDHEVIVAQKVINKREVDAFYENAYTFSSGLLPLMKCLKKLSRLKDTHFSLMVDDAHDLNENQIKALNSWIAFRDNTTFSFKVATAKVDKPGTITATGGTILEGHDFTIIDMEQPYQNKYSDFGKLAQQIVQKRLDKINVKKDPEDFFPLNKNFEKDLHECQKKIQKEAESVYGKGESKKISDYVYKFARAEYFRNRASKANLPPYSGFETLVHISTGVIRNLLEPCYLMFDKAVSNMRSAKGIENIEKSEIQEIQAAIQTEVILDLSKRKWELIRDGLDKSIEGCTTVQAKQIYQLFDNLAIHFRDRLLHTKSEPRAIAFTISETNHPKYTDLLKLLRIARKAQILYTYTSSAKDLGKREKYFVPNRMLWPERKLDPVGQHARVSLKTSVLWEAASRNIKISMKKEIKNAQLELF